ncbi:MAG: membrane protein insertase YidC [Flavobacteriaceae bacterium]|nr:MAG: membrane protein insertase YidC [Flavobacteriaceae bacterium]
MRELNSPKKNDYNQLISIFIMSVLMFAYISYSSKVQKEKLAKEQLEIKNKPTSKDSNSETGLVKPTQVAQVSNAPQGKIQTEVLSNQELRIEISSQGAQVSKVEMLKHQAYNNETKKREPLFLIKENNSQFGLQIPTATGVVQTQLLNFTPSKQGNSIVFSAPVGNGVLQYIYTLLEDNTLDFKIKSSGLKLPNSVNIDWKMDAFALEKGRRQETQFTEMYFSFDKNEDVDDETSDFEENEKSLDWIAFKQQFFASILSSKKGFEKTSGSVKNIEEGKHIKNFDFKGSIATSAGELNEDLAWNFTPLDLDILKGLGNKFDEIIPFGWSFIGGMNKYFFIKIFKFLHDNFSMSYGIIIMWMTIVIKIILSPIMYKQHKQGAMMRVLKPEIDEINLKYKDDALKKQQATMDLYSKAGASPFSGCLPALLQIPIFYALFQFFPNIIDLRGKSFLHADDLTSYDSIAQLPFDVPMYGSHVSLFAILYCVFLLIYTKMTSNNISQPTQEGMPDMKFMMYLMPVFFVLFLNSYASGLSWYYLVSNILNIGIVLVIKHFLIDEEKIHQLVQTNKAKPKKESKFGSKFNEILKQAQEQQELKNKK